MTIKIKVKQKDITDKVTEIEQAKQNIEDNKVGGRMNLNENKATFKKNMKKILIFLTVIVTQ